jgi:hypothetical protein
METIDHLERISKLRQRLLRFIKLGEPNQLSSTIHHTNTNRTSIDLTANVEECVRRLFNTSYSVETFIQDVQRILNVTIKSNLTLFLKETLPLAHQYLQQHQYDPLSWETFKMITLQTSSSSSVDFFFSNKIFTTFLYLEYHSTSIIPTSSFPSSAIMSSINRSHFIINILFFTRTNSSNTEYTTRC